MTKKESFWKGSILYVWSNYYQSYIANYSISLYPRVIGGISTKEWKKIMGLDSIKDVKE